MFYGMTTCHMTSQFISTVMTDRMLIRVDAHEKIALGHLMRCLALAEALRLENFEPHFVSLEDADARAILESSGFEYTLVGDEVNTGDDVSETKEILKSIGGSCLLIDSYNIDSEYTQSFMNRRTVVGFFDDFGKNDIFCDIVLNGALSANEISYDVPLCLLGGTHAILSKEYWTPKRPHSGPVNNVLITLGGVDHYNLSTSVLRILEKCGQRFSVSVVIGPYYDNQAEIESQCSKMSKKVYCFLNPTGLHGIMDTCDMAVSAGGFTLYELATLGIPTVGICLWENQKANVVGLARENVIEPLFYEESEGFLIQLEESIVKLVEDEALRRDMSFKGQKIFDGKGAIRAANQIAKYIRSRNESG